MKRHLCFILLLITPLTQAQTTALQATSISKQKNIQALSQLPLTDQTDFESVQKNLIDKPSSLFIISANGHVIWNMDQYSVFQNLEAPAPSTVHPSLWRQAKLNTAYGLFKVIDHIYQIRGYDLSVMSIIEGQTGYIIIDPLTTQETAKAAIDLVYKNLGKKPIIAVIYTHSHIDHFGGVKGIISENDVKNGKIKIIAPENFLNEAISENVIAGNAMSRRAIYMYGPLLARNAQGQVDTGLGKSTPNGIPTLIPPTHNIQKTGEKMTIDGVDIVFQLTPDTEAPAEMNFFFPQWRALCIAENATHTMHNLYTLRGAKVRDAKKWSSYLKQSIEMFGANADVVFASHNWPTWGHDNVIQFLEKQRDLYKYIHDQTLRLINEGYNMDEIAEVMQLPQSLMNEWYNHGYYGSLSHNVKAVYQRYMGWFDANPAHLNPLPPVPASKKLVEYMGGEQAILAKAKKDYDRGEYRFVAQVLNYVVFANPNNQEARNLLASTYEQLGFQTENGTWRNFYLMGAQELRHGVNTTGAISTTSADIVAAMTPEMFFDYLGVKLNGPKADGKNITLNVIFSDTKQQYILVLKNSVLNYIENKQDNHADATLTLERSTLNNIILKKMTVQNAMQTNALKIDGDKEKFSELLSLLDQFEPNFNIVTP